MEDDDESDNKAKLNARVKSCADRQSVEKAVNAHAARAECSDMFVTVDRHSGLVAYMYQRDPFKQIEDQKPDRGERERVLDRIHFFRGLGSKIEEGGADADARTEGDDHPNMSARAEGQEPTEHRRQECRGRDGEDDQAWRPRHAEQMPATSRVCPRAA